jgi:Cu-processing system permease protein
VSHVRTIAGFTLRESLRRRVFMIVGVLTFVFLVLYGLGTWQAFEAAEEAAFGVAAVDDEVVAGATLLGLGCFGTLFLGAILAVFLTLGAVRGDAERGLLQPILVRDVSRGAYLLGRWVAAAGVCAGYVVAVFLAAAAITYVLGGWWPDRTVMPALGLAFAVALLAAMSIAGSIVLSTAANGIAVFMAFGAGLVAGLLGQIAEALGSGTLGTVSDVASWALPFEALYQSGLSALTADTVGFTRFAIDLGPFGGAQPGGLALWPWSMAYLLAVGAVAWWRFSRQDL